MPSLVSVILCTRNRAQHLRATLDGLRRLRLPADIAIEIIVADNGSTDATPDVCRAAGEHLPLRRVHEPRPGKGYAYARGVAAAAGDVLLFTDDDVRVPPDWIEAMSRPILSDEADILSGRVHIAPHLERPWLIAGLRSIFALTDGDPHYAPMVLGANLAVSRRVLQKVPAFDVHLGPGGLGGGDEVLFYIQAIEAGYRVAGALGGIVEHHFEESRLTRAAILKTGQNYARSDAYITHHWAHGTPRYPRPRAWLKSLELLLKRLQKRPHRHPDRCDDWELQLVSRIAWLHAMADLRGRPHHYAPKGTIYIPDPASTPIPDKQERPTPAPVS